jgi:hypothetical protein
MSQRFGSRFSIGSDHPSGKRRQIIKVLVGLAVIVSVCSSFHFRQDSANCRYRNMQSPYRDATPSSHYHFPFAQNLTSGFGLRQTYLYLGPFDGCWPFEERRWLRHSPVRRVVIFCPRAREGRTAFSIIPKVFSESIDRHVFWRSLPSRQRCVHVASHAFLTILFSARIRLG